MGLAPGLDKSGLQMSWLPDTLVSVVIPTRNRSVLLQRAVTSVLNQTHRNLEIVVVDDASTDDTEAALARMHDRRIRYIRQEISRGAAAARNTGIRAATGDAIAFLDDDDEWEAGKTEEQLKPLRDYDAVICASALSRDLFRLNGKRTVDLEDLRQGKFTAGGTSVLMARTSVLKNIAFDESLPRYQDWDLFIRTAMQHTIAYLNMPLVLYNEGAHARITNSLLNYHTTELEQQFRMLHKHKEFFGRRWFRRHMSRALLYGVKHRPNRLAFLRYVISRYGAASTLRVIGIRLRVRVRERLDRIGSTVRLATRRGAI